jgi:hypothetical protein
MTFLQITVYYVINSIIVLVKCKVQMTKVIKVPVNTGVLLRSSVGTVEKDVSVITAATDDVTGNIFVRGNDVAVETGFGPYNWILSNEERIY